jgi:hypothetical protein
MNDPTGATPDTGSGSVAPTTSREPAPRTPPSEDAPPQPAPRTPPSEDAPLDPTPRAPQYKGAPLDPARGPGLGCFWIQMVVLAILLVATPLTVVAGFPTWVSAAMLIVTLVLLLFAGQTVIFLLRLVAADRRSRRRPLGPTARPTVGDLDDRDDPTVAPSTDRQPADASTPRHPADASTDQHPADPSTPRHPADASTGQHPAADRHATSDE